MTCSFDCPCCGKAIDIIQGIELAAGSEWVALLHDLPISMMGAMFRYLELFRPAKQSLRWSRRLSLTEELMLMIKSGTLERGGMTYAMPMQAWEAEMMRLVNNKPASLVLPLKSNGYLLSIMFGRIERNLAMNESRAIDAQRNRGQVGAQSGWKPVVPAAPNPEPKPEPKTKSAPPADWASSVKKTS